MASECVRIKSESNPLPTNDSGLDENNVSDDDDEHGQTYSDGNCHIYLRKFDGAEVIPGLLTNVAAIFREDFYSNSVTVKDPLVSDVVRQEEKAFTTEICRYLVQNGTKDIQVVTNFSEYVKPIEQDLVAMQDGLGVEVTRTERLKGEDRTDVTVVLLLTCCGQLQQLRMGRLVIDSYRASRVGVIIIGNSALLKDHSAVPAWDNLLKTIRNDGTLKDHLEIVCKSHRVLNRKICNGQDLQEQSPCGGCNSPCGTLDCGHKCPYLCHSIDPKHTSGMFRCYRKCKKICPSGHKCMKMCWENCDNCDVVVKVQLPCEHFKESEKVIFCYEQPKYRCMVIVKKRLKCGHFKNVTCSADASTYRCQQTVGGLLKCGHGYTFQCWQDVSKVECKIPCQFTFKCGHSVIIACHQEQFQVRKLSCGKICEVKLKCGHQCGRPCHLENPGHENNKCQRPCVKKCPRGAHRCCRIGHICGEPCEPCKESYEYQLGCGHVYSMICSDEPPDHTYVCKQGCLLSYAFCHHQCNKTCAEECGSCHMVIQKVAGNCPRKHIKSYKCQEKVPDECKVMTVPKVVSDCGHRIQVPCHEADTISKKKLSEYCDTSCKSRFDQENECGHKCRGTCADCFQGRFHEHCKEPCGKVLICGHSCTSPCGMVCPPCRYPCMNNCDHGKCEYECGVPCVRSCEQPCTYICKHSKCSKLCSEVCNKNICYEPCEKVLECGHPCVGFCGEDCPPYCRLCSPEELLKGSFSGNQEIEAGDRFIYLKDCRHCIESDSMESWISVKTDQILPIRCPICSVRISWIRRYSSIMSANFELINAVRIKLFGKPEEIESILLGVRNEVEMYVQATEAWSLLSVFKDRLLKELDSPMRAAPKTEEVLQSISLEKAKFLKWACQEWIAVTQILAEFKGKLISKHYDAFKDYWEEYMYDMIDDRAWPLHPNEIRAARIEKNRLGHTIQLYSRMSTKQPGASVSNPAGLRVFQQADDILKLCLPYTERMKKEFLKCLKQLDGILQCTIKLTDNERYDIVRAFGEGSGRWFKCQNGHVYVVTECGGATEVGQCNECGASVGGENHVLVEQNYLATEMDGAQQPLYPTVLIRNYN